MCWTGTVHGRPAAVVLPASLFSLLRLSLAIGPFFNKVSSEIWETLKTVLQWWREGRGECAASRNVDMMVVTTTSTTPWIRIDGKAGRSHHILVKSFASSSSSPSLCATTWPSFHFLSDLVTEIWCSTASGHTFTRATQNNLLK